MPGLDEVLSKAIKLVEPSEDEMSRVEGVAKEVIERVKKEAEKSPFKPEAVLGGSFAKGTWLRGEADIDIFLMFPHDAPDGVLEKDGLEIALSSLRNERPTLRYAEHPYVEAYADGIRVNVVPCFKVPMGRWRSAADRSPYHTDFIAKNFDDGLRREARLLKKFMKSLGIYGAEIKVQGFSGYVCEVLVWKFRSFKSVIEEAANFRERHVISFDGFDDSVKDVYRSPLIILDPIDRRRNLGAAISQESVGKFILSSRRFLKRPEISYFKEVDAVKGLARSRLLDSIVVLAFKHPQKSPDILYGELKRSLYHLTKQVEARGFKVLRGECASDERTNSAFIFLLESMNLPPYTLRVGPTIYMKDDVDRFLEKNIRRSELLWIRSDARVVALQRRKVRGIRSLLDELIGLGAKDVGLASGLREDVIKSYKIYSSKEVLKCRRLEWLKEAMLRIVKTDERSMGAD
ncbi:MAG: CCA tRNA nucleotidyltransferase [Nitrososphaerota archaeon]